MLFNTLIISRARSRRSYVIEGREEALARRSIVPSVRSARSAKFAYVNFSLVTCCGGAWHTRFHERRAGEPDDDNQRHKTPANFESVNFIQSKKLRRMSRHQNLSMLNLRVLIQEKT